MKNKLHFAFALMKRLVHEHWPTRLKQSQTTRGVKWLLVSICLSYVSALAAQIETRIDAPQFLKESFVRFNSNPAELYAALNSTKPTKDLELLLYAAHKSFDDHNDALSAFARALSTDKQVALAYQSILFKVIEIRNLCKPEVNKTGCLVDKEFLDTLVWGASSQDGDLLLIATAAILQNTPYADKVFSIINSQDHAKNILLSLYQKTPNISVLEQLLAHPLNPNDLTILLKLKPNNMEPWHRLALNNFIISEFRSRPTDNFMQALNLHVTELLEQGLIFSALDELNQIKINTDEKSLDATSAALVHADPKNVELPLLLAAAFIQSSQNHYARALLDIFDTLEPTTPNARLLASFINEYLDRSIPQEDIFYYFLEGINKSESEIRYRAQKHDPSLYFSNNKAWSVLVNRSPLIDKLLASYLVERHYSDIAQNILSNSSKAPAYKPIFDDKIQKQFFKHADRYFHQITNNNPANDSIDYDDAQTAKQVALQIIKEAPLPAANKAALHRPDLPQNLPLPVNKNQIIQYEYYAGDWYIIYLSSAVDPTHSHSSGGYWIQKTLDGTNFWGQSIYLGIQEGAPYTILPSTDIPMMVEDKVRLIAHRKDESEKHPANAPSVMLAPKVVIEFNWHDMSRDQDNDGLNDLLEYRLGTHPLHKDSDFDGVPDAQDKLPLETFVTSAQKYNPVAMALLDRLANFQSQSLASEMIDYSARRIATMDATSFQGEVVHEQQTLFIHANAKIFQGIAPPTRLIFLDKQSLQLKRTGGDFNPLRLDQIYINADGTDFFIVWNTGWTGGSFRIRLQGGEVDIENLGNWIGQTPIF